MIITKQKEKETLLKSLRERKKVFLVGCGDCASACNTGGQKELDDLSGYLRKEGVEVTGSALVAATCNEPGTGLELRKQKKEVADSEALLVMSCGAGVQSVAEKAKPEQAVLPGCDSLFLGNIKRVHHYSEKCSTCGDCVIGDFGGLCPVTRCPKSLLNGPCGGAIEGNCEVDNEAPCIWILIYERMKNLGELDRLYDLQEAKHNTTRTSPGHFVVPKPK